MIQKEQRKVKSTNFVYKMDFKLLSAFTLCVKDIN